MLHKRLIQSGTNPNSKLGKIVATEFMCGAMTALQDTDPRIFIVISSGRIITEEFKHLIKND